MNRVTDRDRGWKKHRREMKKHSRTPPHVKVGVLGDKANDATADGQTTVILVASVHEFGSPTAPERSFIRGTFDAKHRDFAKSMGIFADQVLAGRMTTKKALGLFGEKVVADTKSFMAAGIDPPLADGSTSRLKDTGQLYGSLAYEVVSP